MNKIMYKKVADELKRAKHIALCVHKFPDGDAIGSMVALALALKKIKKNVYLFSPSTVPLRYNFLPLFKSIKVSNRGQKHFDLAVAIDCASVVQLGDMFKNVFNRSLKTIEIDHHAFRKSFAHISFIDKEAAAVGEIVYHLLHVLKIPIDSDMASAMLVSMIVETGSFRLPTVRSETFSICADLISRGVNYYSIVERSYWTRTKEEAALLGLCFSRIKFYKQGKIAYTYVTSRDMRRLGARDEDVDPIADQIRMLKNVKAVLLFREMKGRQWRVSLRSKGLVDIGRVAEEFGGGGHPDVAGCFLTNNTILKDKLIKRLMRIV
ncbi:MAG: bifunctional oligoribonuclease/PAP phosphatase NrnA [Candidatus Omnitrophota bacterium]